MTSVPKPLKFLRGHYGTLKETLETVASGDNRRGYDAECRPHYTYAVDPSAVVWQETYYLSC